MTMATASLTTPNGRPAPILTDRLDGSDLVKLLLDPRTREILGCTIVGPEATELIHQVLLAKKAELTPEEIATMVHAHPSLSEGIMEVSRAAEGWAIHV